MNTNIEVQGPWVKYGKRARLSQQRMNICFDSGYLISYDHYLKGIELNRTLSVQDYRALINENKDSKDFKYKINYPTSLKIEKVRIVNHSDSDVSGLFFNSWSDAQKYLADLIRTDIADEEKILTKKKIQLIRVLEAVEE